MKTDEIISCALDCDIRHNILSRGISQRIGTHNASSHKMDIVDKFTFITCGEDGTIKLIDLVILIFGCFIMCLFACFFGCFFACFVCVLVWYPALFLF